MHGKTLTALGSYWKGRKPLILNKACILGCLLPATDDPARDLEIFEKLMAMDDESFVVRWKRRPKPKEILADALHRPHRRLLHRRAGRRPASVRAGGLVEARIRQGEGRLARGRHRAGAPPARSADAAQGALPRAGGRGAAARGGHGHRPRPHLGCGQRPSGHERPFVPGAGRAARHHALRPPAARGRHLLRLRSDSLRGGPARLRCLCLRPQSGGLHAHLGCLQHRRRLRGEPREAGARTSRNWCDEVQAEIDQLGVETDGKGWRAKAIPLLRRSALPADWLDGAAACRP